MMHNNELNHQKNLIRWVLVIALSVGLAIWFWLDLWLGGGLIGGDIYSYYYPQKAFFSDSLQAGYPVDWNPLVGHGYSAIAESQTGIFYPFYQILYRLCDVNDAYNFNHLLHYIIAFVSVVLLGRELGLGFAGAALSGLVFVYGWFAPRCCLEWAIVTGGYLPWAFWLLIRFLRTGHSGYLWGLSLVICLQLLAGHYNLAFITLLSLAIWLVLQTLFRCQALSQVKNHQLVNRGPVDDEAGNDKTVNDKTVNDKSVSNQSGSASDSGSFVASVSSCSGPSLKNPSLKKSWGLTGLAIALGLLMSSLQLLPSWELKQVSQRRTVSDSEDFSAGYGHIPPWYLSQVVMPWYWYSTPDLLDQKLNQSGGLAINSSTNMVEAHLYFGLIPLILAGVGAWSLWSKPLSCREVEERTAYLILGVLGVFGLIYALGWLLFLGQFLPGFGFFRGPGRYGILTSLAVALWAGRGWEMLKNFLSARSIAVVWCSLFLLTLLDLSWVSQKITYSTMVVHPSISQREDSEIRKMLLDRLPPARLFTPGPNAGTLTGIASTPVYLGIGPAAYFDASLTFPEDEISNPSEGKFPAEQIDWLARAGVTHVLGFAPPSPENEELTLVWSGIDFLLNPVWARSEPLYLSELSGSRDRADWLPELTESEAGAKASDPEKKQTPRRLVDPTLTWREYLPHQQSLMVATPIDRTLIMTELYDPAWKVTIDGESQTPLKLEGMYRGVRVPAGIHQIDWQYSPDSFVYFHWLSIAGFTIWILWGICLVASRKKNASDSISTS